jgi:hypothetical protein
MTDEKKKQEVPLGEYAGDITKLTQDQMLGQGGGVIFYEVLDSEGKAREHLAMPCLLRDRPKVKAAMRKHAVATSEMARIFSSPAAMGFGGAEDESAKLQEKIAELEEMDTDALLTIAYYSFRRTDQSLQDKDEEAGKLSLIEWMDERQLREILNIALGLNRFELPSRMGAV